MASYSDVIIVGHGTSPKGKGWGARIDEHTVIRLKNPTWQTKEDYGRRLDYLCSSTETMPAMLDYKTVPKQYWAQPKRGKWSEITEARFRERAKAPLLIPLDIYMPWLEKFWTLRKEDTPNISVGLSAIIFASALLKPDTISLVGFDNLLNPHNMWYDKADRGRWVTRHEWHVENAMLPMVEAEYGVKVIGFR